MAKKSSIKNKSILEGTKAADVLTVKHNEITVTAGKGKDKINVNSGSKHKIYGEAGNDIITVKSKGTGMKVYGDDAKSKLTGKDTFNINGGKKNSFYGGKGADTFNINGGTTNYLYGGAGNDVFVIGKKSTGKAVVKDFSVNKGNTDSVKIAGGPVKSITVSGKNMIIKGGKSASLTLQKAKNKTFTVTDTIGTYTVSGSNIRLTLHKNYKGTLAPSTFVTMVDTSNVANGVTVNGNAKDNVINVGKAGGTYHGGKGNDTINITGNGTSTVSGDEGNDIININGGQNSIIYGGAHKDTFNHISGTATIMDYEEGETLSFANSITAVSVSGNNVTFTAGTNGSVTVENGVNTLKQVKEMEKKKNFYVVPDGSLDYHGSDTDDIIVLNSSKYSHTVAYGGAGDDKMFCGAGWDLLFGDDGNDYLSGFGSTSEVTLVGGAGNDVLISGNTNDKLFGGTGADKFIIEEGNNEMFAVNGEDTPFDDNVCDSFVFNSSSTGKNTIYEFSTGYGSNNDLIIFDGITADSQADDGFGNYAFHLSTGGSIRISGCAGKAIRTKYE